MFITYENESFVKSEESAPAMERKALAQKIAQDNQHACYVLITCNHPNAEGKMHVELTYEGDPTLAAYLLENAQGFIEPEES